jgi:hypothetical protein
LPLAKAAVAPGWHLPHVFARLAGAIRLLGSDEGRMSCEPWHEAQLAAETCPPRMARPWNESLNVLKRSLRMPYLVASRTEEWQGEQTSAETFPGATGESGASAFLIVCSP